MKEVMISIDVEDWFCVKNMAKSIPYGTWDQHELRINRGLDFILAEFKKRKIRGTFFMLGWLADKCPGIVEKIESEGHEVATHGYNHQTIDTMEQQTFKNDLRKSVDVINNQLKFSKVGGYRAPSFSITEKTWWALDCLKELGLKYDSSIYPVSHPDYGVRDFGRDIKNIEGIVEVPMNYAEILGLRIPISGGGYFRLMPYFIFKLFLKAALKKRHVVLYFHPWEFDPEQPRVKLPLLKSFRHYVGLSSNRSKFIKLLDDFNFTTMSAYLYNEEMPLSR
ncbi:MAG: DUF3473 domain-containing protein [Bacteriovoracaceae bacterium]|jgi:peptidoglycan-N-acetylglucosamine deacetylase|nr:DUF3473 domain-containing protein [Bacteriovoracaceae bacterium]